MNRAQNRQMMTDMLTSRKYKDEAEQGQMRNQPCNKPTPARQSTSAPILKEEKDENVIDLKYIIKDKPKAKIVRKFMKDNLESIKTDGEEIFEMEL